MWPSRSASRKVSSSTFLARPVEGHQVQRPAGRRAAALIAAPDLRRVRRPGPAAARWPSASVSPSRPRIEVLGGDLGVAGVAGLGRGRPPRRCARRGVNRREALVRGRRRRPRALGTKRFWAACLVTPMLLPMSVHEAPERRAWSTKWPMRWSATSPRWSAASTASVSCSRASVWTDLDGVDEGRRANVDGLGHASTVG